MRSWWENKRLVLPLYRGGDWVDHKLREFNKKADELATEAITTKQSTFRSYLAQICTPGLDERKMWPMRLRASFDGGAREGYAGAGWYVEGSLDCGENWLLLCEQALYLH